MMKGRATFASLANDPRVPVLILATACVIVYANSLWNGFVWDDRALVLNNRLIREWSSLPRALTANLFAGAGEESNFFRPVQTLTFMVDYRLWGLRPFGYHLTNLLLHLGCTLAVYLLLKRLAASGTAFIAALLFAVHPLQTEAVTYISGRADSLAVGFGLLSLLLYIRAHETPGETRWYVASLATFSLALLSKEMAMIFPALIVLYDLLFDRPTCPSELFRRIRRRYLPYLAVLALYGAVRALLVSLRVVPSELVEVGPFRRILLALKVFGQYLLLLVAPQNLHMERWVDIPATLLEPAVLVSSALVTCLIGGIVWAVRRSRPLAFGLLWFLITYLPISNLIPLNAAMAEHWMYLPAIGLFLSVALAVQALRERGWIRSVAATLLAVILLYAGLSIRRNRDWSDEVSFYQLTLKASPKSFRVQENLGLVYMERGQHEQAVQAFKTAIAMAPGMHKPYIDLGTVYKKMGRIEEAIEQYQTALVIYPRSGLAHLALAETYAQQGLDAKAIAEFEQVAEVFPRSVPANIALGDEFFKAGKDREAVNAFRQVLAESPSNVDVKNKLGLAYARLGEEAKAVEEFQAALKLDPGAWLTLNHLGISLLRMKRYREAAEQFEQAVKRLPNYPEAQNNLGIAYARLGRFKEADAAFRKAIELRPDSEEFKKNLAQLASAPPPEPSLAELEQAVRANPGFAKAHYNLGSAYGNRGDLEKATIQFQEALRLDPRNPLIHYAIGLVGHQRGDYETARRSWERALQFDPKFALARQGLALLKPAGTVADRAR